MKKKAIWANLAGLVFVFLALAAVAIVRDGRLLGHDVVSMNSDDIQNVNADGSLVINTTTLAEDVSGYSGPVPVEITISAKGTIDSIHPLENAETPGFFKRVVKSGILEKWNGKTPAEALDMEVDGVTGATYSSIALIANVKAGLAHYADSVPVSPAAPANRGWEFYAALAVFLCGAIIPLFVKNKRYRIVQQLLNVGVLGFWAGTFVDYTAMIGLMSAGITATASIVILLMIAVAFIYPLFGRPNYYCTWICPLGSLQELAGHCNPSHKWKLTPAVVKVLKNVRLLLWGALMLCLWTGFFVSWIDYELFTGFIVDSAALGVLIAGGVVVVLSLFINRPYCRFVCPTGCLFHVSEKL
ncbi:MAG: FMN-binding protein [Firmicutes bacterium]|nr:FMN-binding protein [Bacillota bacterium]MCM1401023.1 FMN-binding protein [Bacteroides sp.]MCM1476942.1 FMN-binding protein [Bacteroides sp.]